MVRRNVLFAPQELRNVRSGSQDSVVEKATSYRLDGPGIDSQEVIFSTPKPPRPCLWLTQLLR